MNWKPKILLIVLFCILATVIYYQVLKEKMYSDFLPQSFVEKMSLENVNLIRDYCGYNTFFDCFPQTLAVWIGLFVLSTFLFFSVKSKRIFLLLILISFILTMTASLSLHDSRERGKAWVEPVISREEYAALDWIRNNTVEKTVFASDIFGGELIMGNTLRLTLEGGDWAIIPNVIQRMNDANTLYTTTNPQAAWEIARKYNCSYDWLPNREILMGFGWKQPEDTVFKNTKYFTLVFENKTKIYKVNENLLK
ncbi:Uncharacterised protein [uncultured archaeon]|nr:Uncharacterised protein [uncultured archaeon]